MGDQRNEKAKVGRLKGDVGRFSGDLRGHKVPSEEAMGGPRGPLEGPRAVQGRQQDLCPGLTYLVSVPKLPGGG